MYEEARMKMIECNKFSQKTTTKHDKKRLAVTKNDEIRVTYGQLPGSLFGKRHRFCNFLRFGLSKWDPISFTDHEECTHLYG